MTKNTNLHKAKKEKNDEFYTQLSDVENELKHYKGFFKGKKVLCNCNDDKWSSFFKYFSMNFEHLGLKSLTCISYNENGKGKKYQYNGDINGNRMVDDWEINITELDGNGSFSSEESVELLKECDVVVTNPPFSKFREFVSLLNQYEKKFLIIGNMNAIAYQEIFPLIKNNMLWLGCHNGDMGFTVPSDSEPRATRFWIDEKGVKHRSLGNACWYTNIEHNKRNIPMDLYKKYNTHEFPKYDNYDAINVNKTCEIPMDYDGIMGVPITFLSKHCPSQFEIVGIMTGARSSINGNDGRSVFYLNNKAVYARILIKSVF